MAQLSIAQNTPPHEAEQASNPASEYAKQQLTEQVLRQLDKIDWNHVDRTTSGGTVLYTIPVVVHVLHNYGVELIPDTTIYKILDSVNSFFLKTNPDTVNIIAKFKAVAANTKISFKLATIDPRGNPTKGVEHIFTYLTYAGSDQVKVSQWPQERYLNIWTSNSSSPVASIYYTPTMAAYSPYYDGLVLNYGYFAPYPGGYIALYFARYLNLPYPCYAFGPATCSDNDGIPDTPPCNDDFYSCTNIYDTVCDTPNVQNIMSSPGPCGIMFTYGQGQYMQNVLQLDYGKRDSLVTPYTSAVTGVNQPVHDLWPVADFSVGSPSIGSTVPRHFYCQGQNVGFVNKSWNDTIVAASWAFSNSAHVPTSTALSAVLNAFHEPGWVTVSLAVTGNNTGTTTLTDSNALFIADSIATNALGYVQEFVPSVGMGKWPMFNYYGNGFKWQLINNGYFDNTGLEYTGYDVRTFPENTTGMALGDVDDIFTPAFDLTGFGDSCFLNFMTSGATRFLNILHSGDSLEVQYSADHNYSWHTLETLRRDSLFNKNGVSDPYAPLSPGDWMAHHISLPAAARTAYSLFRFRYHPGADSTGISMGNNFYLDHFNFSGFPESIAMTEHMPEGLSLVPNPTQAGAYAIVKDKVAIQDVTIIVTDITGKCVYKMHENTNNTTEKIEIPATVLPSIGLYLVHIITARINQTEKLVVQ